MTALRRYRGRVAILAALVTAALFVVGASANLTGSSFEGNDGNLVVNGGAGAHDWDNAPNLSIGTDLQSGQTDNSFGQGAKEDDVNTTVVAGSIPNSKADLARFAVAGETVGSNTFLYLAWTRENQSGTVNFDFEINAQEQPNLTTPGPKVLVRTANDLLINYAFAGGSNTPTLTFRKWTGTAWSAATAISSSCSEGATNAQPVSDTLGVPPNLAVSRPAQQFGEASINLVCAGIIQPNVCAPFSSAYVKSRSSTAFTSEIKDFIAPVHLNLANCGSLTVIKHTSPADLDQVFHYTTSGAGLAAFDLNDVGAGDTASNTKTFSSLQAGQRTVTEGDDPSGFAFNNVSCTNSGGNSSSTLGKVATVNIVGGGATTCTYVNDQQLGAIKVLKQSIKGTALAGATFSIAGQSVQSGADGTACVDHLVFGNYDVQETAAPAGYSIDDSSVHSVAVNVNETCAAASVGTGLSFNDTPLTDIAASAHSQAVGGTQSSISCVDGNGADVGNSPRPNDPDPAFAATGLAPGTYVCTIVVDP